jgi:hypothetical protein
VCDFPFSARDPKQSVDSWDELRLLSRKEFNLFREILSFLDHSCTDWSTSMHKYRPLDEPFGPFFILCSTYLLPIFKSHLVNCGYKGFSRLFMMVKNLCQFRDRIVKCGLVKPRSNLVKTGQTRINL